jgi:phosphoglycerol transferase MdoB-like AlkP superfamily enzyme
MSLTATSFSRGAQSSLRKLVGVATGLVARRGVFAVAIVALLHLTAIAIMAWFEVTLYSKLVFVLTWGLLNFFWLVVLRRAAIAAALSLVLVVALITFSEFKFGVLWIQVSFVDLMVIETDTAKYLLQIYPWLGWAVVGGAIVVIPLLAAIWWADPLRVRLRSALAGFALCFTGLVAVASAVELNDLEAYHGDSHVSYFARSGVKSVSELMTHGMLESDATVTERLKPAADTACKPAKPPHIILVHDESSFDIRSAPGIKVPPNYGEHFKSFDGKERNFLVEGVGGPSWYAEYSVMTGLSARSFGRFSYFVLGIASGRVQRGLPNVLRDCGYRTHTLFPALGAFMNSRSFQTNVGVQTFRDQSDLGANELEPDKFFYDKALSMLESERGKGPSFFYIYLVANHFPWYVRWRPDLMPQWQDLQNVPLVDEYLRRQTMSAMDYDEFVAALKQKFPGEPFLLVRYGDHQPDFSTRILEPSLDRAAVAQRVMHFDQKYYTTYYAIDAINFKPVDVSSAVDPLDGPYLPLVILEAAGLPLDPSFVEQKNILRRCKGIFYACNGGAEARRFNRLLIDAGLIKQL